MMRYLEYDFLKDRGLQNFDNWVAVFGQQKTDYELAPAGNKVPEFRITLDGIEYTDKTEAGKALQTAVTTKVVGHMDKSHEIGEFQGFRLSVYMDSFTKTIRASLKGEAQYSTEFTGSYPYNLKKLENTFTALIRRLSQLRTSSASFMLMLPKLRKYSKHHLLRKKS